MRLLIIFLCTFLWGATNVYVDEGFDKTLPKPFEVKKLKDLNDTDAFYIIGYKNLPKAIENNFSILLGIGKIDTYLISHKPLNRIKTVINPNLPVKILFSVIGDVKELNGSIEDFEKNLSDAIVTDKKIFIKDTFYYDLEKLGLGFNRFYLVGKCDYLKTKPDEVEYLKAFFENSQITSSVLLSAYYMHKKLHIPSVYFDKFKEKMSKKLKVAVTPYWPPFDIMIDGELQGIGIDFWKLIAKKAHIDYEFVIQPIWIKILEGIRDGSYDITPNTSMTLDRRKYAVFSKPYVEFPLAIACDKNIKLSKIEDIKSIAVGYNYTAHKMMKEHYPNLNYITAKSVIDAFKLVEDKKAQCVVDILPSMIWLINQHQLSDIKIYFKTPFTFKLQVMLSRNAGNLKAKIDRAIESIDVSEKNLIMTKYLGKVVIEKKDYSFWIYILLAVVAVVLGISYFLVKNYKRKSEFDALTKVYNRGRIEKIFNKITQEKSGSIIFFDIDNFKKINDTFGHEKGDYVLKKISSLIASNLREKDYFGRWGGEEFLVILPDTTYERALIVAEKIRKIVEASDFDGIKVTISLGVTDFKENSDPQKVVKEADIALYQAKENGKNQVKGSK